MKIFRPLVAALFAAAIFTLAQPAFSATPVITSGGDTSLVQQITVPKQGQAGQLLIVVVNLAGQLNQGTFFFDSAGPVTAPAGFSPIDDTAYGGMNSTNAVFVRVLTANEPVGGYTFSWPMATTDQWIAILETGQVDSSIVVQETDFDETNPTRMVAPSISAQHASDTLLCVWDIDIGDNVTKAPTGMTIRFNSGAFFVADQSLATAGVTGTRTIVGTSQTSYIDSSRALSVALH